MNCHRRPSKDGRFSYCLRYPQMGLSRSCILLAKYQRLRHSRKAGGLCVRCGKANDARTVRCNSCKQKAKDNNAKLWRKYNRELKIEVMEHYGGCRCACCGETTIEFLQIDHVNGNGSKHRKEIGGGNKMYKWLKRNGYPSGFQVLCANCNFAKGKNGICPHKRRL